MDIPIQLDDIKEIYEETINEFQRELKTEFDDRIKSALFFGIDKWETKKHICMNLYILGAMSRLPMLSRKDIRDIGKLTIPLEVIVQSLDDTVDIEYRPIQTRWDDDVIKFFEMSYLFLKLYEVQRKDYKDSIYSTFFKSRPKALKVMDNVVNDVLEMTRIPFIEKAAAINIKEASTTADEVEIATEATLQRAEVIRVYFNIIREILPPRIDRSSFDILVMLTKFKRGVELLNKDVDDILLDLENKSYTPVSAFFEKYKFTDEFKDRMYKVHAALLERRILSVKDKKIGEAVKESVEYMEGEIGREGRKLGKILEML